MKSASFIQGRHWKSGKSIEVVFENGWIREIHTLPNEVASSKWILPPWIDCQVNGYAGIDFQQSGLTQEAMEHATWALKKDGCVGFFPTLITCPWQEMMDRLTHLKALTKKSSLLSNHILGWHLEGPFLSPETGYRGAHDPQCMEDPKPEHLEHIRSITEADPVLLTLAPERKGSMAFIRKAKKLGMRVSLGHTNADTQTLHEAFKAGARALTHLGNACPQQLDR
ncbi:MAG: N-acetylglucosamine-6-phosphate deacetylase, partial [Limisphaerales bacterium]